MSQRGQTSGRHSTSSSLEMIVHPLCIFVDRVQRRVLGRLANGRSERAGIRGDVLLASAGGRTGGTARRSIVVRRQQFFDRRVHRRFTNFVMAREKTIVHGRRSGLFASVRRIVVPHAQRVRR